MHQNIQKHISKYFCCCYTDSHTHTLYLISIISPTTEFHFAVLVIEWEPRDVYLACALEDTRGHVQTIAVMFDHNVGVIRAIESLISTKGLFIYIYIVVVVVGFIVLKGVEVLNICIK